MRWYIALIDEFDNEVKEVPYNDLTDALEDMRLYIDEDNENCYLFDTALDRIIIEHKDGELTDLLELL